MVDNELPKRGFDFHLALRKERKMKIVISERCSCLFNISTKGVKRYAEIKGIKLYPYHYYYFTPVKEKDIDRDGFHIVWCTQRLNMETHEELKKALDKWM